MKRLSPSVLGLLLLAGCGPAKHTAMTTSEAAKVQADCRSVSRSGVECEEADRVLSADEHKSAQSAFRKMTEAH